MLIKRFVNEAITDYSSLAHQQAMAAAVAAELDAFGCSYSAVIAGEDVDTGKTIASVCPAYPDRVVGLISSCGPSEVDRSICAAQGAFARWAFTNPEERAERLMNLAAAMRARRFELVALISLEVGKDWFEADADVAEAIDFCEYYARLALVHFEFKSLARIAGEDNCYSYIPLGVGAVIAPWNFPLAILTGMTAAAVVSGNTVVVKPSSDTPVIARRLMDMVADAGFPPGVINLVPGSGGEIGDYLVTHPAIRFVSFTGSADVGLRINELMARPAPGRRWMTRYISEMGGKNAILVDETADLDSAATGVVRSAFGFQGQKCSACSRLIVDRRVKADLLERIVEKTRKLPAGDPWSDPCIFTGPVATPSQFAGIMAAIERGASRARLVIGGRALERPGWFIEPTVFDAVRPGDFLEQEEIFGPVLAVTEVASFDEGLAVANDTRYGLTGAVYSQSIARLDRARIEMHCGNLYLNRGCTGALVGVHPFGGFNMSGTDSKAGGPDYLLNFTQGKTTSERVAVTRLAGLGV